MVIDCDTDSKKLNKEGDLDGDVKRHLSLLEYKAFQIKSSVKFKTFQILKLNLVESFSNFKAQLSLKPFKFQSSMKLKAFQVSKFNWA